MTINLNQEASIFSKWRPSEKITTGHKPICNIYTYIITLVPISQ